MRAGTIILLVVLILGLVVSLFQMKAYDERTQFRKTSLKFWRSVEKYDYADAHPLPTNWAKYSAFAFGGAIAFTIILWVISREVRRKDR